MRDDSARRTAAALQRQVLCSGDALYPVRLGNRVYVSLGGRLPRFDQARQRNLLEHAQFYYDPDGWLRVRPQKRRAGLQKITSLASAACDSLDPNRDARTTAIHRQERWSYRASFAARHNAR